MRIALLDADMMWRPHANGRRYGKSKADVYPNLALMKISAWHKAQGDEVEWYNSMNEIYDKLYISKVFSSTPDSREIPRAREVIWGGSGFYIHLNKEGKEVWERPTHLDKTIAFDFADSPAWSTTWRFQDNLPSEIEHTMPDYSLYPMIKNTAYGFLSRGCPRGCDFCHVKDKEGRKAYKVADLKEWWDGQKNIVLMDPNILACREWKNLLKQLADSGAKVDINQGIDARLLTEAKAKALAKVKLSTIHFAWDRYKDKEKVLRGLRLFAKYYPRKLDKGHQAQVFVLTNFDTTVEQDLERIYTLRDMGFEPYIMVYNKASAPPHLQKYAKMGEYESYLP